MDQTTPFVNDDLAAGNRVYAAWLNDVNRSTYTVATPAAVRALPIPDGFSTLVIRNSSAYQGGGLFFYDSTSALADDGGTVLRPATLPALGRWLRVYQGELHAEWFGILGDNSTDNAAGFALLSAALLVNPEVKFGSGTFLTSANWVLTDTVTIRGAGCGNLNNLGQQTFIKALPGVTKLMDFGDTIVARCRFEDFRLGGAGVADYCFYATHFVYANFTRIRMDSCVAAHGLVTNPALCHIGGTQGWNNTFFDCEFSVTQGDGLFLAGVNNSSAVLACKIHSCAGIGLVTQSSSQVKIGEGTTIEGNLKCGIFAVAGNNALSIQNAYILANGSSGYTFTSPSSVTVKADVILNGGSDRTTMSNAFPNEGVLFEECYFYPFDANQDCCVFGSGYTGLTIDSCDLDAASPSALITPLFSSYWSTAVNRLPVIDMRTNSNFGPDITFLATSGVLDIDGRGIVISNSTAGNVGATTSYAGIPQRNYALTDLNQFANVVAGGTATWERSPSTVDGLQIPVWSLLSTQTGASPVFGFVLDASFYPKLWNKYFMFGMWARASTITALGANVYVATAAASTDIALSTNWTWKYGCFKFPTSGNLTFGGIKHGTSTTGICEFAAPILAQLGTNWYTVFGQGFPDMKLANGAAGPGEWFGTAIPSAGTWVLGDIVKDRTAAAAATPGWQCTTAGAAGVFVFKPQAALGA